MVVDSIHQYENEVTMDVDSSDKLPKECVTLCIEGLCERVDDMNTRAQAIQCLTTFTDEATRGFISERMAKIMNEPKNPKVLRGALLWMVSAVEDFGVAHLKHKDIIHFCLNTGLDSSDDAIRNATRKLLGAFLIFINPRLESRALYSAVEAKLKNYSFEEHEESKQLEKMSLDDPQGANLDATNLDEIRTSFYSYCDSHKEEIFREDMEAMKRCKTFEARAQCTRCDIPLRLCMCETIVDTPFGSFIHPRGGQPKLILPLDMGRRITDATWAPHKECRRSRPYPSIVLKEQFS